MTQEQQHQKDEASLPRNREAVDWWLKKWGRQAVIDGEEPLNREDVERLKEANGGSAEKLYLVERDMHGASLYKADLDIAAYNEVDCKVMQEILAYLRSNH